MVVSSHNSVITSEAFYLRNTTLATEYKAASPSKRQSIIEELYKLDLPLFQAWRIFGEEREDYRQEAYLWLCRCLDTYKPDKGPFVHWLRFYIRKTYDAHTQARKPDKNLVSIDADGVKPIEAEPPDPSDPAFWDLVKQACTSKQWELIDLRYRQGIGIGEIAKRLKVYPARVRAPLLDAFDKIKELSLKLHHDSQNKVSTLDPSDSRWLNRKELGRILGIRDARLKELLEPKRDPHYCPFQIDPRDIIRLPTVRIRFLETDKGLIYPRFIRRGTTNNGRAGLL